MSTIKTMRSRGASSTQIAAYVKLSPGTVRHHVRRLDSGAADGRCRPRGKAMAHSDAISHDSVPPCGVFSPPLRA